MNKSADTFVLPSTQLPLRLDKVLAQRLGLGLRSCRDFIAQNLVTVDGRVARKGDLVCGGQVVRLTATRSDPVVSVCPKTSVVVQNTRFAAVHKPAGLHSTKGKGPCLETLLPDLGLQGWHLVNRLDLLTSGLVVAVQRAEDLALYRSWQSQGQAIKWYVAVVHGKCADQELRFRIDDARRTVVRVLATEDEPLRWTRIFSLGDLGAYTVVAARILKGRRHQIRAHLAQAGHPILGDPVYGHAEAGGLFLHHWQVVLPEFMASTLPSWTKLEPKPEHWSLAQALVEQDIKKYQIRQGSLVLA